MIQRKYGQHYPIYTIDLDRVDADSMILRNAGTFNGIVKCFLAASDSTIWYATARVYGGMDQRQVSSPGLHRINTGETGHFSISNGLSSSVVNTIAIAPDGAVWCGTDRGLSRYGRSLTIGVESEPVRPKAFAVVSNHPNPFNPITTITYTLPASARVELSVYSITGQKVRTLVSGRMEAGAYSAIWDGKDENGKPVSSGVYIAHLRAGKQIVSHKMVLVR
jgi:hypothetical protein